MENEHRRIILETLESLLDIQLDSVRQLLNKSVTPTEPGTRRGKKRKSLTDLSIEILTEERRPLHVDELVDLLKQRHGRFTDRDSLSSALAKKAKQRTVVRRVAPASFAICEQS